MRETLASTRYARALFDLAKKENCLPAIETSFEEFAKTISKHLELIAILQNPTVKGSEKISLAQKIIPQGCPELFKDFFLTLIAKKRTAILLEVQKEFHKLFERDKGILDVEMLSAAPFSTSIQEKIKKVLAGKLRSEIRLIPKVDTSLLGGFLLRFNDREIDCSFKNRIHEIEQQLFA